MRDAGYAIRVRSDVPERHDCTRISNLASRILSSPEIQEAGRNLASIKLLTFDRAPHLASRILHL